MSADPQKAAPGQDESFSPSALLPGVEEHAVSLGSPCAALGAKGALAEAVCGAQHKNGFCPSPKWYFCMFGNP